MNFSKIKGLILILGDLVFLYAALALTLFLRYGIEVFNNTEFVMRHFKVFTLINFLWLVVFYVTDLYSAGGQNKLAFRKNLARAFIIAALIAVVFFYLVPDIGLSPKRVLFIDIAVSLGLIYAWREIYNRFIRSQALSSNLLVVGESSDCLKLVKTLRVRPELGYSAVAIYTPDSFELPENLPNDILFLGQGADLKNVLTELKIAAVTASPEYYRSEKLVKTLYQNLNLKFKLYDIASFYEKISEKIPVESIGEIWFLENLEEGDKKIYEHLKRILDILLSVLGIILTLPFVPFVALAIKLNSRGSLFFKQIRAGRYGKPFLAVKFRSMVQDAEKEGAQWAKKNDQRVTSVGKFIRKTRIDEIPQLWNILRGEMSFVGPRPERPEFIGELEAQIPFYRERLMIKPGLTGWAQINFPYGASVEDALEKLQYELYYIKHRSLTLDIAIILRTINTVLRGAGQ